MRSVRHAQTIVVAVAATLLALTGCSSAATAAVTTTVVSTATVTATVSQTLTETVTAQPAATEVDEPTGATGASGATTSAAASSAPDPCQLLTQDEASTLAGIPLAAGVSAGPDGAKTLCQYTSDPNGPTGQVGIFVGDGAEKSLQIDRDVLSHTFTTVPGIGDEAYLEDFNIFFRKGANWAQINLVLLNDPSLSAEPLKTAAGLMASRLP